MNSTRLLITCLAFCVWCAPARAADFSFAVKGVLTREISEPNLVMSGGEAEAQVSFLPWLGVEAYYDREFFHLTYVTTTTFGSDFSYGLGVKLQPFDYGYVTPFFGRVTRTYGTAIDTDYRYGGEIGVDLPLNYVGLPPNFEGTVAYKLSEDLHAGTTYASLCAGAIWVLK